MTEEEISLIPGIHQASMSSVDQLNVYKKTLICLRRGFELSSLRSPFEVSKKEKCCSVNFNSTRSFSNISPMHGKCSYWVVWVSSFLLRTC